MNTISLVIAGIASLQFAPLALAGEPDALVDLAPAPGPDHKSWQFEVASYGFLSGIDGTVDSGELSAEFDFEFGDLFEQLDFALMLFASATYENKFSVIGDIEYIAISADGSPRRPVYDRAKLDLDQTILSFVGAWRILDRPEGFLELGGGFRYLSLETELRFQDSTGSLPSLKSSSKSELLDGLIAVRGHHKWSDKVAVRFYGDIGAGDSDLTWQVWAGVGYSINEHTALSLGFRHVAYELSDGDAKLDISLTGPQIGVVHRY